LTEKNEIRTVTEHNIPVLTAAGIVKNFGGIKALRGVDIKVNAGEVTAIVGDNGSGKSTLIKILSGDLRPDEGTICTNGREYSSLTPKEALAAGISAVYQDLSLDDYRDAAANIFLGNELTHGGIFLRRREMRRIASSLIERLNIGIPDITLPVGSFSGGQRQAVAVARAIYHGRKLVIFDEPTAAMGVRESSAVLRLISELASRGIGIVIICHNLHQVFDVADKICIMRRGRILQTVTACGVRLDEVQRMIMEADYVD